LVFDGFWLIFQVIFRRFLEDILEEFSVHAASSNLLSKKAMPPQNDQILMPFQYRFWNVLAPFLEAKMAPKSIKNLSKLGFRTVLFRHCFFY